MAHTAAGDAPVCVFNGVDGVTGDYLVAPAPPGNLPVGGQTADAGHAAELRWRLHRTTAATFAPIEGVDPTDLAATGWAARRPRRARPGDPRGPRPAGPAPARPGRCGRRAALSP